MIIAIISITNVMFVVTTQITNYIFASYSKYSTKVLEIEKSDHILLKNCVEQKVFSALSLSYVF